MTRMPERGVDIELRDQQGNAHRSGVLECNPRSGTLVLAPPADRPFEPGTRLLISWPEDNTYWVLPVLLVTLRASGPAPLLVVEVADDAWREERREYVRSSLDAGVLIDFEAEDSEGDPGPRDIPVELIDLSEVAMRGIVSQDYRDWLVAHMPVTIRLDLSGDVFRIPSEVLLAKPAVRIDLGLEVVVLFDRPVERVEALRDHLAVRAELNA